MSKGIYIILLITVPLLKYLLNLWITPSDYFGCLIFKSHKSAKTGVIDLYTNNMNEIGREIQPLSYERIRGVVSVLEWK